MVDLKEVNEALTRHIRPQSFPVAIRMCESADELPEKVRIPQRDMGSDISLPCHCHDTPLRVDDSRGQVPDLLCCRNQHGISAGKTGCGRWQLPGISRTVGADKRSGRSGY